MPDQRTACAQFHDLPSSSEYNPTSWYCSVRQFRDLPSSSEYNLTSWYCSVRQFQDLPSSSEFNLTSWCCNDIGCGENGTEVTATSLGDPIVIGKFDVTEVTASNATIIIPRISAGDSNVWVTSVMSPIIAEKLKTKCVEKNNTRRDLTEILNVVWTVKINLILTFYFVSIQVSESAGA